MARASSGRFYGWTVVGALAVAQIAAWGVIYYGFAVFLLPMERDLGWSRSELSGAFSVGLLTSAATAVPIGRYIDRHGARGPMLVGSCAAVPLLIAWACVDTLAIFYIIWFGLGLTMAAVLYEPAFAIVVAWFDRKRATALAILTSLAGFASTIFVPLITQLVIHAGWRTTLFVLSGLLALILIPIYAWIVPSRPSDVGLHADGLAHSRESDTNRAVHAPGKRGEQSGGAAVWTMAVAFGAASLTASAALVHALPFLIAMGLSAEAAASAMALAGAAQVPGRVAFGVINRWIPPGWLAPCVFGLQATGLACLALAHHASLFVFGFALLFGAGNGLATLVRSTLIAERFGSATYATASGKVAACGQLARAAGPVLVAWAATPLGGYGPVWWLMTIVTCAGAVMLRTGSQESDSQPRDACSVA